MGVRATIKPKRVLILTLATLIALCVMSGFWLWREKQSYARNRQLIASLERGDAKTALALVNAGADPNTRLTPTSAPTFQSLLNRLLHHTPPPINSSKTALHLACRPDYQWNEETKIPIAAQLERARLVQAMLAHGGNARLTEEDNETPLHLAVQQDRLQTVELLLRYGANVNARNRSGVTPLTYAIKNQSPNVTRFLLTHGADPNLQDDAGWSSLHNAAMFGAEIRIVSELLAHGADPNLKAISEDTPLTLAQDFKRHAIERLLRQRKK